MNKVNRIVSLLAKRNNYLISSSYVRTFSSNVTQKSSTSRLFLKGIGLGALVGTLYSGYSFYQESKTNDNAIDEKQGPIVIENPPKIKPTRKIINTKDDSGLELILFQYQTCPFCCKVRAFLDHAGLSYSVVEVDAVLRQSIKWSPYKKVPILLVKSKDGKYIQLNDSSMIISTLASYLLDKNQDFAQLASYYITITYKDEKGRKKSDIVNKYFLLFQEQKKLIKTSTEINDEMKWRKWVDETLVHLISPNVYRSKEEALETFNWFSDVGQWSEHFPSWERNLMVYVGAAAMWAISKRLKKRHNLTDDVRSHIYDACDLWTNELKQRKVEFMGGKVPNLADLAVFGVLSSMEGCSAFKDCLDNTDIGSWFYAVKMHIMKNKGTEESFSYH